jgi:hypothetical protein
MNTIKKFCVFCGQYPDGRNREHIIPRWLIELSGDPNRKAQFGIDLTKKPPNGIRSYSFNSFVFPACEQCNEEFSDLEDKTKEIVTAILHDQAIGSGDWNIFLDWLDKVRIGIWLGFLYLNKNLRNISPKFHIKKRIGVRDRFVIIYRIEPLAHHYKGLMWMGAESLAFQLMPSCFTLIVNNYCFFNASSFGLVERRLGYPFARSIAHKDDIFIEFEIAEGFGRTRYPVLRKSFVPKGSLLCQAIFKEQMRIPGMSRLYHGEYVKSHCIAWDAGRGSIFQELGGKVSTYPVTRSKQWLPLHSIQSTQVHELLKALFHKTLDYQVDLFIESGSTDTLSDEEKKARRRTLKNIRLHNEIMKQALSKWK